MAEIQKLKSLMNKLWKAERDALKKHTGNVIVGYQTSYAVYVHENTRASHMKLVKVKGTKKRDKKSRKHTSSFEMRQVGQAKFLEQPAREMQRELGNVIMNIVKGKLFEGKKVTLRQALLIAGLRLQRESQKLVPVDTGQLKNSAFTDYE